jgi:hypothetical protein
MFLMFMSVIYKIEHKWYFNLHFLKYHSLHMIKTMHILFIFQVLSFLVHQMKLLSDYNCKNYSTRIRILIPSCHQSQSYYLIAYLLIYECNIHAYILIYDILCFGRCYSL